MQEVSSFNAHSTTNNSLAKLFQINIKTHTDFTSPQ